MDSTKTSYRFVNRHAYDSMIKTWGKSNRVSHLNPVVHENICEALEITGNIDGDYVEIGVYLGGSALTAMNYITEKNRIKNGSSPRKGWLIDTYDGFNYSEAQNSPDLIWAGTHKLYGVQETKRYIQETLSDIDVPYELVECNICQDNLPSKIKKIAVANIDVDMYEPTLAALNKVADLVQVGGIIIAEDPASTPALYGGYLAMHEFLETEAGKKFNPIFKQGQYFLIKGQS